LLEVNCAGEATKVRVFAGSRAGRSGADQQAVSSRIEWPYDDRAVHAHAGTGATYFTTLRELKEKCSELLGAPLPHLSMGMSGDFEVAVEEGRNYRSDWNGVVRATIVIDNGRKVSAFPVRRDCSG
jgi:hypothetical protein